MIRVQADLFSFYDNRARQGLIRFFAYDFPATIYIYMLTWNGFITQQE